MTANEALRPAPNFQSYASAGAGAASTPAPAPEPKALEIAGNQEIPMSFTGAP